MRYEMFRIQMRMLHELYMTRKELQDEIDDLCYEYAGVKGVSFDKESGTYNQQFIDYMKLELSEKLDEPQKELEKIEYAINQIEPIVKSNLSKLSKEIRKAVKLIYWEKLTYHQVGKMLGYTDNGLWHRVKREIESI